MSSRLLTFHSLFKYTKNAHVAIKLNERRILHTDTKKTIFSTSLSLRPLVIATRNKKIRNQRSRFTQKNMELKGIE